MILAATLSGMDDAHTIAKALDNAAYIDSDTAIEKIVQTFSRKPVEQFSADYLVSWLLKYKNQKYLPQIARVVDITTLLHKQTGASLLEKALEMPFLQMSLIANLVVVYRCIPKELTFDDIKAINARFPKQYWFSTERNKITSLLTHCPLPIHYAALQADSESIKNYQAHINAKDAHGSTPLFYALPSPRATRQIIELGGFLAENNEDFAKQFGLLLTICYQRAKTRGRDVVYDFYIDSLSQILKAFPHVTRAAAKDILVQAALLDVRLVKIMYEIEPHIIFANSKNFFLIDYLISRYEKMPELSNSLIAIEQRLCLRDSICLFIERGAPIADTKKCADLGLLPPSEKEELPRFSLNRACDFMDYTPEQLKRSCKDDSLILAMSTDSNMSGISE